MENRSAHNVLEYSEYSSLAGPPNSELGTLKKMRKVEKLKIMKLQILKYQRKEIKRAINDID